LPAARRVPPAGGAPDPRRHPPGGRGPRTRPGSIESGLSLPTRRSDHRRRGGTVGGVSGVYTVLADLVVVVHFTYLAVLVFGGVAAWRWPRLIGPHVAAVAWAAGAVTVRYDCPLTSLEEHLRERTGRGHAPDGFLRHYV